MALEKEAYHCGRRVTEGHFLRHLYDFVMYNRQH